MRKRQPAVAKLHARLDIHSPDGAAREYGGLHRALDEPQFGINVIDGDVRLKLGSFRNWARHVAGREKPMLSASFEIGKPLVAVCELS